MSSTIAILIASFALAMISGATIWDWLGEGAASLTAAIVFVGSFKMLDEIFP
jgi:hypothetical protein